MPLLFAEQQLVNLKQWQLPESVVTPEHLRHALSPLRFICSARHSAAAGCASQHF
jgi:hypothetical protein